VVLIASQFKSEIEICLF